jgi:hypothetical protein
MTERRSTPPSRLTSSRIYWLCVLVWAFASVVLGERLSADMKFRVNDLSQIPGAGMVMRDTEGVLYHVNSDGRAREIFPELAPPEYKDSCLDCVLVTGEQLSQTNEFCAAGVRRDLPRLDFELPCRSWAVLGDGPKVVSVTLFLIPVLLWPILRATGRAISGAKPRIN